MLRNNFRSIFFINKKYTFAIPHGEVSEWSIEHAWKACVLQGTAGSNPALSAFYHKHTGNFINLNRTTCLILTNFY